MSIYIFKTNAIGLLHINKRDQPVKFAVRERMKKQGMLRETRQMLESGIPDIKIPFAWILKNQID